MPEFADNFIDIPPETGRETLREKMPFLSPQWLSRAHSFRNFLAASTVSLWGNAVFDIAMPLYVWDRTHSPLALSLVSVALHLPYFVMAPLTGYAVDHFNNRKLLMLADMGQIGALGLLLALDWWGSHPLAVILLAVFLVKSLSILFETVATFCLVPALVDGKSLNTANRWFLSSQRLMQILGPLVGGVTMTTIGFQGCVIFNILTFGATLFYVFRMRNLAQLIHANKGAQKSSGRRLSPQAISRSFLESVRYVWNSPLFRPFIFAMFFWNLSSLTPNAPTITYYFRATHGYSSAQYGIVIALFGVASILGFILSSRLENRWGFRRTFVGSGFWQALLATAAFVVMKSPLAFVAVFAIARVGSSVLSMGTFFLRQTEVPAARLGAVNATIRMFFMSAAPLSALLQGFILDHVNVETSFLWGALCLWGTHWFARQVAITYAASRPRTRTAAA